MAASRVKALWNHPAGPKTTKWVISIANVADFSKPPEKIYPQQMAVTATGLIWSRYSMVIIPKNWNLFTVNLSMAGTGLYQISRKLKHDYFSETQADPAKRLKTRMIWINGCYFLYIFKHQIKYIRKNIRIS